MNIKNITNQKVILKENNKSYVVKKDYNNGELLLCNGNIVRDEDVIIKNDSTILNLNYNDKNN